MPEHENSLEQVAQALGDLSPDSLELLATLHYIYRSHTTTDEAVPASSIIEDFKLEKGEKFSDEKIDRALEGLRKSGLVQLA